MAQRAKTTASARAVKAKSSVKPLKAAKKTAASVAVRSASKSVVKSVRTSSPPRPRLAATVNEVAKVSISMPAAIASAVREIAGRGQVSAYVSHAVERQLALDRLSVYVDDVEERLGRPISEDLMAEAAAAWHDVPR